MERGRTFDGAASLYDSARNGYPDALFADIARIAGLAAGDRALEVGCGSGLATAGLIAAGLYVTAVDPGPALIEIAKAKFPPPARARFELATFENWSLPLEKFRLVAAAQSWHWAPADVSYAKAADALAPEGWLAIFGHTQTWSDALLAELRPIYAEYAPELSRGPGTDWYLPSGPIADLIAGSGRFGAVQHRGYAWRRTYSAAEFADYLGSQSDHLLLSAERRETLLGAVRERLSATVDADWATNLYMAPRA